MRVCVEDVELHVQQIGPMSAPPVLLLHGFTGSSEAVAPLAQRLAHQHRLRVIAPDLVGHGRSQIPDEPEQYRVESMAQQVLVLSQRLEFDTFHLAGYSMGARVALTAACAAPQRLRSLTLIGTTPGITHERQRRERVQADEELARLIESDFTAFIDAWMSNPLFAAQAALGEQHLSTARAQRLAANPVGLASSLRFAGTGVMTPLHDRLSDCNMPALLIAGALDHKFAAIAESMATDLPDAEVALIADAGHAAHVEQLETTTEIIAAFIETAQRRSLLRSARASRRDVIEADGDAGVGQISTGGGL